MLPIGLGPAGCDWLANIVNAENNCMTLAKIIDVHHHYIPPVYAKALQMRGVDHVAGARLPDWTPERSIELMDRIGIETAYLSVSAPGVSFVDRSKRSELARACNEYGHMISGQFEGRFGYFAVLPMPFSDLACSEAIYALDTLGAAGIGLLASTDGVFLGAPDLDDLMRILDERSAVVFVHPNMHPTSVDLGLNAPGFMVEFPCDTTRAVANLVLGGCLERFPNIRWLISHAGGFVPYVAWRLGLATHLDVFAERIPKGVDYYLRQLYYDTALSPSKSAIAALQEVADPQRILFGSDFPFAPDVVVSAEVGVLDQTISQDTCRLKRADVHYNNAKKLFGKDV